ncbi:ABC-2 type transport system ATP-binding protein [Microbacterium sp. SORGH_AS 1204]|uniref:ABC transporter ATP-binding protein n=1 Tax=Microbacterium sp. SORGH_AS_1204 TaxID=3041785 RepID=UPI0027941629|nr:ABC transporter ATP-binding protein [Microbacterium sp. SORGH_AS_1204]MDQ1137597.1 ABC-2 type transport system ATP-binding protein [Microbacterium sp. SORGH_AS_1204]
MGVTEPPVVVRIEKVRKRFKVRKDNSLKDRIVHFGRHGKTHREDFVAVRDVSLDIEAGTTVALMGANGSGKSTLLKLIGGIVAPTSGTIRTRGRMAALLELGAGFHPDLSGRENVYLNASILGLTRAEIDARFDDIVAFSGIADFIDTAVKFYSSGMYVRLAFSVAIHTNPDILLVDEVLAVGDEAFQRKCMDRIARFRAEGCTIILVSHSAQQVAELCDRGIVLRKGEIVHDGDIDEAIGVLRDVLEGRDEASAAEAAAEAPIRVAGVDILDDSGERDRSFGSAESIGIRLRLESDRPIPRWAAGFSVNTPLGHMVFASNTDLLRTSLPVIDGTLTLEFRVDALHLGAGTYHVHANAVATEEGGVHGISHGATFTVETAEQTLGTATADVSVSIGGH